jgi:hypothetical protein
MRAAMPPFRDRAHQSRADLFPDKPGQASRGGGANPRPGASGEAIPARKEPSVVLTPCLQIAKFGLAPEGVTPFSEDSRKLADDRRTRGGVLPLSGKNAEDVPFHLTLVHLFGD